MDRRQGWMAALSSHYETTRLAHPEDELCIVFDIDGTILDMRHLVVHVLLAYDRRGGTQHFRGLVADDIARHEDDIDLILADLDVGHDLRSHVATFYRENLWQQEAVLAACRPFEGVLGVIRWFQLQPRTHVALNTGRPERLRADTLASLNTVGATHRVRFSPTLLLMGGDGRSTSEHKAANLAELREHGLRIVAVVDNEPENLRAMADRDSERSTLFLHADTISSSQRRHDDVGILGRDYLLRELVPQRRFPDRVEFVWHGVNDAMNLGRFLTSDVRWAEVDVRRDPLGRLVLRHDGFDQTPWRRDEPALQAETAVDWLAASGRSVKLDLKENGPTLREAMRLVEAAALDDDRLWFNAELPVLGPDGFRLVRERHPRATISCPVDFLVPLLSSAAAAADEVLSRMRKWGVTRLSLRWNPLVRALLDRIEASGWEVNLYGVPDLESFLDASLLLPTSVTADFNFPEWGYHGRGSGEGASPTDPSAGERTPVRRAT
jgi:hypothetical protein